jgi:hypothetical protein
MEQAVHGPATQTVAKDPQGSHVVGVVGSGTPVQRHEGDEGSVAKARPDVIEQVVVDTHNLRRYGTPICNGKVSLASQEPCLKLGLWPWLQIAVAVVGPGNGSELVGGKGAESGPEWALHGAKELAGLPDDHFLTGLRKMMTPIEQVENPPPPMIQIPVIV